MILKSIFRIGAALLIVILSLGVLPTRGLAAPENHSAIPAGLSSADWAQVSALLPNYQQAYIKASTTDAGDAFGASVALSGNTLVVGVTGDASNATGVNGDETDNSLPGAGAVYVFTRNGTTWSQQAYIKASNPNSQDGFGTFVTISGDTLAVTALGEDSNASGVNGDQSDNSLSYAGAVYVFTRSGTTWSQQAYIKASNPGVNDLFGESVVLSGDTLAVGADMEDSNATGVDGDQTNNSAEDSGAVYVFTRSGTTWSQQAYIKASNTGAGDAFGFTVALEGNTLVAGAGLEASGATGVNGDQTDNSVGDSGAVYVFTRNGTIWSQQAYIKASNTGASDAFGVSISLAGNTLAVGAEGEGSSATGIGGDQTDDSASGSGAVYIFTRSGTTWSQQAYIKAFNTGQGDKFGRSVVLSGNTLAVGAPDEDSNATGVNKGDMTDNSVQDSGAVYVFTRSGTTWSQQAYVKASNPDPYDRFGVFMTFSGGTLAVNAANEDSNATGINGDQTDNSAESAGAAYVFLPAPAYSQQAYIKASNTEANDTFGYIVALSGNTLAVGVPGEASNATGIDGDQTDNSASGSGAVYVFTRSGATWSQQAYIKASNTGAGDNFGVSLALSGDTLAVGANGEASNVNGIDGNEADDSASNAGAVYVFVRSGTTWSQQSYIKASNSDADDNFGVSVALSSDTLAVGANGEASSANGIGGNQTNNSASASGAVYVFTRSSSTWSQQAYVKASNSDADDKFGGSVALSDDTLAVGANGEASNATGIDGNQADNSASNSGATYVFTRSGTTWSQQAYVKASNAEADDTFGVSVALSGDTLAVGADGEASNATGIDGNETNNSASGSGAAYVFTRSGTTWSQQAYVKASNTDADDQFGISLALSGNTLAVGANGEASTSTGVDGDLTDNSAAGSGAVYVFTRTNTTWNQKAYVKASNTEADDNFGVSVAISGSTLAVGANGEDSNANGIDGNEADNSASGAGATYIFVPVEVPELVLPIIPIRALFISMGAHDGWVRESSETSSLGSAINSSATTFNLGDDATKKQYRAILSFNTSSIPDNAVITRVMLKVKPQGVVGGSNPLTIFQGFMVDIKKGIFGTSAVLQVADFQTTPSKTYGPFIPALVSNLYSINLTDGKAYINKVTTNSGLTQIRLRFKLDDNNNNIANYLKLYSGNAPVADRPQLVITYYLP